MNKRLSILTLIALFVSLTVLQAQERKRPTFEENIKRTAETLKDQLKLSDDQATKVTAIVVKYSKPFNPEGDRQAQMKERQENNTRMTQAIDSLLTKEQKELYIKWQEEMRNRRRNGERNQQRPQN